MHIEIATSYVLVVLAVANILLIMFCIVKGIFPTWLLAWQSIWGASVAVVLTIIARKHRR